MHEVTDLKCLRRSSPTRIIRRFDLGKDELNAYSEDDLQVLNAAGCASGHNYREGHAARALSKRNVLKVSLK